VKPIFLVASIVLCCTEARAAEPHPASFNPYHCRIMGDAVACYAEPFVVDAYSDVTVADVNFRQLKDTSPKWLLTTTDPTRRALVVHAGDPTYNAHSDGYVAELYFSHDEGNRRFAQLTDDQRASGYKLDVLGDFLGGGLLVVYRTYEGQCEHEGSGTLGLTRKPEGKERIDVELPAQHAAPLGKVASHLRVEVLALFQKEAQEARAEQCCFGKGVNAGKRQEHEYGGVVDGEAGEFGHGPLLLPEPKRVDTALLSNRREEAVLTLRIHGGHGLLASANHRGQTQHRSYWPRRQGCNSGKATRAGSRVRCAAGVQPHCQPAAGVQPHGQP
jgi:hypothetical protein